MDLRDLTFVGPLIDDAELLALLPDALASLLRERNGFVAFRGGLHVRGACSAPAWHSLRAAWDGPQSVARRYRSTLPGDVPFAQDALGDQFLLRNEQVWRLSAESDQIESLGVDVVQFLAQAADDPIGYLSLEPLLAFEAGGGRLQPGQLLSVFPPYIAAANGPERSFRAIAAADRLGALAALAAQIRDVPDGARIEIRTV